jgi:hypothetical protein
MNPLEILNQLGGLQSMARELGVSPQQAQTGAAALLPAILGGFKKQAQPAGLEGLGGLLNGLGGGGLLDNVLSPQPTNVNLGNDVLGQIFGSRDVSRSVATHASSQTGLDPALLKKMLPILAMLVAGYMAKQGGGATPAGQADGVGGLGGLLGKLAGGGAPQLGATRMQSRSGGLASMLDLNGDGNPLDDIMGMAQKLMR